MDTRNRIAAHTGMLLGVLALASVPAQAERYAEQGAVYDYAQVLSAQPIVRYVTVSTPVRECWQEDRRYSVARSAPGNAGGTLMGAIIGGVLGHQIGSGRGNDAATVAGAVIGATVGSGAGRDRVTEREVYSRPVERCQTNYTSREEERVDGYRVTYRYHGQKYATRMPYDPGEKLRIRVDVRPAE